MPPGLGFLAIVLNILLLGDDADAGVVSFPEETLMLTVELPCEPGIFVTMLSVVDTEDAVTVALAIIFTISCMFEVS